MKKLIAGLGVALAMAVTPAAAQDCPAKVRIGVEGAYPPFSEVTPEGRLTGFDIDMALALCQAMAAECTLVQQDWDGIIPGLLARKYDAIIASMSITEERRQKVDFTDKYYQTPARFIARKGAGFEISADGLKGKKIGVQRATIHDNYISDNYPAADIVRYGTQDEVYLDLKAGRIDMALQDSVAASDGFLKQPGGEEFEFIGPSLTDPKWFGEGAGIAIRKNDDRLRQCFNAAIDKVRANGTYQRINDKYFDFDVYGG